MFCAGSLASEWVWAVQSRVRGNPAPSSTWKLRASLSAPAVFSGLAARRRRTFSLHQNRCCCCTLSIQFVSTTWAFASRHAMRSECIFLSSLGTSICMHLGFRARLCLCRQRAIDHTFTWAYSETWRPRSSSPTGTAPHSFGHSSPGTVSLPAACHRSPEYDCEETAGKPKWILCTKCAVSLFHDSRTNKGKDRRQSPKTKCKT